jgi:hypothetical protein
MKLVSVPFSAGTDISIGMSIHEALIPAVPTPIIMPLPALEVPVTLFPWMTSFIGFVLQQTKVAMSVRHRGVVDWAVLEDSDTGYGIPDLTIAAPVDAFVLIRMLVSKRAMFISASTVKAEGKPMGAASVLSQNFPCTLITCWDTVPNLPTSANILNLTRLDVAIGVTLEDYVKGWVLGIVGELTDYGVGELMDAHAPRSASGGRGADAVRDDQLGGTVAGGLKGLVNAIWQFGHDVWMGEDSPRFDFTQPLGPFSVRVVTQVGEEPAGSVALNYEGFGPGVGRTPILEDRVSFDDDGTPRVDLIPFGLEPGRRAGVAKRAADTL